jgi:selenocysteine lyase/cysteine desulfurase
LRAAIEFANQIGMERIEKRHRQMANYMLAEMQKRGATSWTSPDAALRCAITTVNVRQVKRMELENWLWKEKKIRIRGGEPSKLRISMPYFVLRKDADRFLAAFDEYKTKKI